MNYEESKAYKSKLEAFNNDASVKLNSFEQNNLGMIPTHIRDTVEYKKAKKEFDLSFTRLREFNSWYMKEFKNEIRKDRKNRFVRN